MITPGMTILFLCILAGASVHAYKKGVRRGTLEGINESLDHLIEQGRLEVAPE